MPDRATGYDDLRNPHLHEWSEWMNGSGGAQYRCCLDTACDAGEIR